MRAEYNLCFTFLWLSNAFSLKEYVNDDNTVKDGIIFNCNSFSPFFLGPNKIPSFILQITFTYPWYIFLHTVILFFAHIGLWRITDQPVTSIMSAELDLSPPEVPEPTFLESLLRYGLFLGAIFQLICILAVIIPTSKGHEQVGRL